MGKIIKAGFHVFLLALLLVLPLIFCFPSPVFAADEYRYFDGEEHSYFTTGDYKIYDSGYILNDMEVTYDSCDNYGFYTNAWKDGNDGYMKVSGTVTEPVTCAFEANVNLMSAPDVTVRFVVTIDNINENPTNITLSNRSINENRPSGTEVGTLGYADPDVEEGYGSGTYTFSLVSGDTDAFTISGSSLYTNAAFDYETDDSYRINIRVSDPTNLTYSEIYTISINDVNETPTNINLSSSSVAENQAANTAVGSLSSTDPDSGDSFTYSLVNGTGDTNNSSFNISGSTLRTSAVLDYETKSSYSVRVRSTDQGGLYREESFAISVTNVKEDVSVSVFSSSPTVVGQPYTVSVGVSPASGAGTPTGTVAVSDGSGGTCNVSLTAGSGSCSLTTTSAGTKTLTASYGGDTNWNSGSGTATHVVDKANSATQITSISKASTICGEAFTVSTSVTAVAPGAGTPAGMVTISDDENNSCTITLAGGAGSCSLSGSQTGVKTLTASYVGDSNYLSSTDTESHTISIASSTTTITGDTPNASQPSEMVTFTAEVEPVAPSTAVPGGIVSIKEGSTVVCSMSLSGGTGSCTSDQLSIGAHILTAAYGGETDRFIGSVSGAVTHRVQQIALSDNKVSTSFTDVGIISTSGGSEPTTYSLSTSGLTCTTANGAGNNMFSINGNTLQRATTSTAGTYSICVQSVDGDSSVIQGTFSVVINDPPSLMSSSLDKHTVGDTQELVGNLNSTGGQDPQVFTLETSGAVCTDGNGKDNGKFTIDGDTLKRKTDTPAGVYQICLQVEDAESETAQMAYTITVTGAPNGLVLSNQYVATSQTLVGEFSLQDGQSPFVYSLETSGDICNGTNSAGNSAFEIDGANLRRLSGIAAGTYQICAQGLDGNGLTTQQNFTITVSAPVSNLSITNQSVTTLQSIVGTLSATPGQTPYVYSLESSGSVCNTTNGVNNSLFSIDGNALKRKSDTPAGTYEACVQVEDTNHTLSQNTFTIVVSDGGADPAGSGWTVDLTGRQVIDGDSPGTLVGTFTSTIKDTTYQLVDLAQFPLASNFTISGNELLLNTTADFDVQPYYPLRVLATEPDGRKQYLDVVVQVMKNGALFGAEAVDDAGGVCSGATTRLDVVSNDILSSGATSWASLEIVRYPLHGEAWTGSIYYRPYIGYAGKDSLSYRACDDLGYCVVGEVRFLISLIPATGFAPGLVTKPLVSEESNHIQTMNGFSLEIPGLGIDAPIAGIPIINEGWDISWLGNNVGWLEGSVYPTWEGNSVLTGHLYNYDGLPGIFVDLHTLKWGDQVIVNFNEKRYIYEVREVEQFVDPSAIDTIMVHKNEPWLTLVTCQGYDENTDSYQWRIYARAVLIQVE